MKAQIIKIGNSHGLRIPKVLLEQCHLKDRVELEAHDYELVIRSSDSPRKIWKEAFKRMAKNKDDKLLEGMDFSNKWSNEWVW